MTGPLRSAGRATGAAVLRYRWWLLALAGYAALAGVLLRDGLGAAPGSLPQGTNALDYVMQFNFSKHFPLSTWLYPFTDWGQPVPGYTGPTPFALGAVILSPTVLVRVTEYLSIFGAGLSLFWIVRNAGGTGAAAFSAGFFYAALAETPQFFEGHVPGMISVALGPPALYLAYRFFQRPAGLTGIPLALLVYLLASVGELDILYYYLFFGGFAVAYAIYARYRSEPYHLAEWVRIGLTASLTVALVLPWLVPYAAGVRPEYTTSISRTIVEFSHTTAQPLWYSLAGFVSDNSFILAVHGQSTPALAPAVLWPVFLLIPLSTLGFVLVRRSRGLRLLWLSAGVAVVLSTGNIYPGLSEFNRFVYDFVPYADYTPAVFRWAVYADFVFAFTLGMLLTDLQSSGLATWRSYARSALDRWRRRPAQISGRAARPSSAGPVHPDRPTPGATTTAAPRRRRKAAIGAVIVVVCVIVVAQNWLVVADPPGVFEFPSSYIAGFQYISSLPLLGSVLTVPFGTDYEKTPWGGVSGSSVLLAPYFTGSDGISFQAGTADSLALDTFVGNGLTYGLSNNISKFLAAANVQYIAATDYPDWSYPTSGVYAPQVSFEAFANQTGVGAPVYSRGYQSIYSLADFAGNVSWHSEYFVYFGSDSLVYEILDQPWYNGSQPLVDGGGLGFPGDEAFLTHATAIVTAPEYLGQLNGAQLAAIEESKTPVIVLLSSLDTSYPGGTEVLDPWNASNGQVVETSPGNQSVFLLLDALTQEILGASAYEVEARAECLPGSEFQVSLDNRTLGGSFLPDPISSFEPLPYNNSSAVTVGGSNTGPPYNGSLTTSEIDGVTYLNWSLSIPDPSYQYVRFNLSDLGGARGLSLDLGTTSEQAIRLELTVGEPDGTLTVPSYTLEASTEDGSGEYAFYLADGSWNGTGPAPTTFGSDANFTIGLSATPAVGRNLLLSNLTAFQAASPAFDAYAAGVRPLAGTDALSMTAGSGCGFDTVALLPESFAVSPPSGSTVRYLAAQNDPTHLTIDTVPEGWGVVELAQTYSPFWVAETTAATALHATGNIGLNVWLINASSTAGMEFSYAGQALQHDGIVGEAIALPVLAVVWGLIRSRWSRPKPGAATGLAASGAVPSRTEVSARAKPFPSTPGSR